MTVVPPPGRRDVGPFEKRVHDVALRVRPTELGALLKTVLRVPRRYVQNDDGAWFWVDPASQLGRELMRDGSYEPAMAAVLRAVLRPGDSFVDVGANEGLFTVLAATLCGAGAGAAVVAVEPQSRLLPVLQRNLELNGCARVSVRAVALDAAPGWLRIYLRPSTNPGASGPTRRRLDVATETVPATTLDRVLDDHGLERVRLVKVDCEGAEAQVMAGAERALAERRIDFIALEFHTTVGDDAVTRSQALHERICGFGYVHSVVRQRDVYHLPGGEDALAAAGDVRVGAPLDVGPR